MINEMLYFKMSMESLPRELIKIIVDINLGRRCGFLFVIDGGVADRR